jgi:DNA-binding transcriptional LysR family regulator
MTDMEIRYFLGVVDNGLSFTRASQALYVAQPAITRHINKLGEELGVKLFDTTKKNAVSLTPAGELFYKYFTEQIDSFNKITIQAKDLDKQFSGEIKIACLSGWDMAVLIQKISTFQSRFPSVYISFYSDGFKALKTGFQNGYYDALIMLESDYEGQPNTALQRLYTIPLVLLFSTNHALAGKSDLSILDFKDDALYLLSSGETPFARSVNETYCKSKGFMPKIKEMPNLDSIFLAIGSGSGYTILDKLHRSVNTSLFKSIEIDNYVNICAIWKKNNANPSLPLLLDTLFE